jgi:hypothetical protein
MKEKRIFYNSIQRKNNNISNISKLLLNKKNIPGWLLENYTWIYEKDIFNSFYKKIKNTLKNNDLYSLPNNIFIEIVYYHYIYSNNEKYNYTFIDCYLKIKEYMGKNTLIEIILSKPYTLLEDTRWNLNKNTYNAFVKFYKNYNIKNYKIEVNDINLKFIKDNSQIVLINSGDFPLYFTFTP